MFYFYRNMVFIEVNLCWVCGISPRWRVISPEGSTTRSWHVNKCVWMDVQESLFLSRKIRSFSRISTRELPQATWYWLWVYKKVGTFVIGTMSGVCISLSVSATTTDGTLHPLLSLGFYRGFQAQVVSRWGPPSSPGTPHRP